MGFWLFSGIDGEMGWKTVPNHRAKHPRQSDKSVFEKKLGGGETNTDCTDITDFIRGATWYWIYYGLHLRLYGAGCLQQEIIRGNPSARQAQINPTTQKNPWKNRSVASALSVIVFEHGERAKGEQAHQWGTVFQTALLLFLLVIPRLRPGLLSLRSVLSSRQNLL